MLRITGYSDKYSVCPGDEITFYVNSEKNEPYKADIVRLIHGDTNPEGPGFKEKVIKAPCNKNYTGKNQKIHGGSYGCIQADHRMDTDSFTLQAFFNMSTVTSYCPSAFFVNSLIFFSISSTSSSVTFGGRPAVFCSPSLLRRK